MIGPPSRPSNSRVLRLLSGPIATGIWLLIIWEAMVRLGMVSELALPAPSSILSEWIDLVSKEYYWSALLITIAETLAGFIIGVLIGIILGLAIASVRVIREAILPIVVGFEQLPRVALAPVFITFFGFGIESKIALAAAICFFPMVINTIAAFDNQDVDRQHIFRVLGATRLQTLAMLRIPEALPVIFGGMRIAVTLALIGAIVAEFVSAREGVAVLIAEFTFQIAVARVFALVFSVGLLGLLLYSALAFLEARVGFWATAPDSD